MQPSKMTSQRSVGGHGQVVPNTKWKKVTEENVLSVFPDKGPTGRMSKSESHGIMDCFLFLFTVFSHFPAIKMYSFGNMVFCHENLQNPSSSTNRLGYSAHGHFTHCSERAAATPQLHSGAFGNGA